MKLFQFTENVYVHGKAHSQRVLCVSILFRASSAHIYLTTWNYFPRDVRRAKRQLAIFDIFDILIYYTCNTTVFNLTKTIVEPYYQMQTWKLPKKKNKKIFSWIFFIAKPIFIKIIDRVKILKSILNSIRLSFTSVKSICHTMFLYFTSNTIPSDPIRNTITLYTQCLGAESTQST